MRSSAGPGWRPPREPVTAGRRGPPLQRHRILGAAVAYWDNWSIEMPALATGRRHELRRGGPAERAQGKSGPGRWGKTRAPDTWRETDGRHGGHRQGWFWSIVFCPTIRQDRAWYTGHMGNVGLNRGIRELLRKLNAEHQRVGFWPNL
jgi:hypothetical protein